MFPYITEKKEKANVREIKGDKREIRQSSYYSSAHTPSLHLLQANHCVEHLLRRLFSSTSKNQEFTRLTRIWRNLSIIEIIKSSPRITFPPIC